MNEAAASPVPAGGGGFTLVYIFGPGHCGSTLLSLLLNGHPRVLSVGEICTIADFVIPTHDGGRKNRELDTPVWQRTAARWEAGHGYPLREIDIRHPRTRVAWRWTDDEVRAWATRNSQLLTYLAEESGADFLVDSSKFPQRLYLLLRSGLFRLKVIDLRRDGRAVVHSYRRRGRSFQAGWRRWLQPVVGGLVLRRRIPPADWLTLRYEDLAAAPAEGLARVCEFLGIDYDEGLLRFRDEPSIAIGGNGMRYKRNDVIAVDDQWRTGRTRRDRLAFAAMGGVINRLQGY